MSAKTRAIANFTNVIIVANSECQVGANAAKIERVSQLKDECTASFFFFFFFCEGLCFAPRTSSMFLFYSSLRVTISCSGLGSLDINHAVCKAGWVGWLPAGALLR
jgi:hypothetical protein